jgi:glutathione S-transferase
MKLYDFELSGNAYKIRLMLALLGQRYDARSVDIFSGENRKPEFLRLNPRGQVPVLSDGDYTVWDSQAILVYLARKYGGDTWLPSDPRCMGDIMQWLAVSENEVLYGLGRARVISKFKLSGDLEAAQKSGRAILAVMEQHLATRDWLTCGRATIADVACYPYVALAPEGGIDLAPYPAVRAWIARVQKLPNYAGMPGIGAA